MEDPARSTGSRHHQGGEAADQRSEPVRSRWTPKPEQILILETIFNSGMVNPPKDETVRIRRLLEKFGSVGDANVFYWFQNRRSRSRRRQRQAQASLSGGDQPQTLPRGGGIQYDNSAGGGFVPNSISYNMNSASYAGSSSSSSSSVGLGGNESDNSGGFFGFAGYPGPIQEFEQNPIFCSADTSSISPSQSEMITVFMNGIATEVGRGPIDIKAMFGGDFMVIHSSGVAVEMNEFGILIQGLLHGESYFLVPRHP